MCTVKAAAVTMTGVPHTTTLSQDDNAKALRQDSQLVRPSDTHAFHEFLFPCVKLDELDVGYHLGDGLQSRVGGCHEPSLNEGVESSNDALEWDQAYQHRYARYTRHTESAVQQRGVDDHRQRAREQVVDVRADITDLEGIYRDEIGDLALARCGCRCGRLAVGRLLHCPREVLSTKGFCKHLGDDDSTQADAQFCGRVQEPGRTR